MANYRKSFNFRNGVQVDDSNFVVNINGLVGVGTTVPTEILDVRGNTKVSGNIEVGQSVSVSGVVTSTGMTVGNIFSTGIITSTTLNVTTLTGGNVNISSGIITASSPTGVVTYYGDGRWLTNLPVTQWSDGNSGFNTSSVYFSNPVGIATNYPNFYLQVGSNPNSLSGVGINSDGNIKASGIVTAGSFSGSGANITSINASNISSGTLNNDRLPSNINISGIVSSTGGFIGTLTGNVNSSGISTFNSIRIGSQVTISSGIITASNFVGNLTGTASTANNITSTSNIFVNSINSGFSTSGISTVQTALHVLGNIGVGTVNPLAQVHLRKTGISSIQLTSDGSNSSTITFGRSSTSTSNNAQLRYGNTSGTFPESTEQSLDIINYGTGNLNFYINPGGAGVGSFSWFNPSLSKMMTLTSSGNLGINSSAPTSRLAVVGNVQITGIATLSSLSVLGSSTFTQNAFFNQKVAISTSSGLYDFQIGGSPTTSDGVGISSSGSIRASGELRCSELYTTSGTVSSFNGFVSQNGGITVSGVATAPGGFTSGNNNPVQIIVDGTTLTFTVVGIGSTSLTLA
jgi:hypothetical protein